VRRLGAVLDAVCDFLDGAPVRVAGFVSSRMLMGGGKGLTHEGATAGERRFVYNLFVLKTGTRLEFAGRLEQDFVMNLLESMRGEVVMRVNAVAYVMPPLGKNEGGMRAAYREGEYLMAFYPVLFAPGSVLVQDNGKEMKHVARRRLWDFPRILREAVKAEKTSGAGTGSGR
jgi:hypothetical protein